MSGSILLYVYPGCGGCKCYGPKSIHWEDRLEKTGYQSDVKASIHPCKTYAHSIGSALGHKGITLGAIQYCVRKSTRMVHRLGLDYPDKVDAMMLLDTAPARTMYANTEFKLAQLEEPKSHHIRCLCRFLV